MFTEQKVYELKYRQYKHEICKMRCKRNKFMVKYQVLESEMGQISVCALPWKWVSYYLILTLGLFSNHMFEDMIVWSPLMFGVTMW